LLASLLLLAVLLPAPAALLLLLLWAMCDPGLKRNLQAPLNLSATN
jgi:hypothetical protein